MSEVSQPVDKYLVREIEDLVSMGSLHGRTWASRDDPGCWLQLSVHEGTEHFLSVLCVLPPRIEKKQVDSLLGKPGRWQVQANHGICLTYYLARCATSEELRAQVPAAAKSCAEMIKLLWGVTHTKEVEMLGVIGPKTTPKITEPVHQAPKTMLIGAQEFRGSFQENAIIIPAQEGDVPAKDNPILIPQTEEYSHDEDEHILIMTHEEPGHQSEQPIIITVHDELITETEEHVIIGEHDYDQPLDDIKDFA